MEFPVLFYQLSKTCVLQPSLAIQSYIPIDLSVTNSELNTANCASSDELSNYINSCINKNNACVGYGGYLEKRNIYSRSTYFNESANPKNERNIHLGIDLWAPAGTSVHAAYDGEVHSFKNNLNFGDYGPTIVLKHCIKQFVFHTLYGHLSLSSIEDISEGTPVKKGQKIGELGTATINGDYPPHLHFQLIKNMANYKGDYPGVCSEIDLAFYKSNCPDPLPLLSIE